MRRWGRRAAGILLAAAAVGLLAGCELLVPPTNAPGTSEPAPQDISAWPPLAEDPGLTTDARQICLLEFGLKPDLPLALQDRREPGRATIVFADDTTLAWCTVVRTPRGTAPDNVPAKGARWSNAEGIVVTRSGLTIATASRGAKVLGWNVVNGVLPPGATGIRAVIGGRNVEGAVGDGLYSLSWPGGLIPTDIVAIDPAGREVGRIDESVLAGLWDQGCPPGAFGCPPPL